MKNAAVAVAVKKTQAAQVEKTQVEKTQVEKTQVEKTQVEKTQVEKTQAVAAAQVEKTQVKKTKELSVYGHRLNTLASAMDDLIANGATKEHAVKTLAEKFADKTEKRLENAFLTHVSYLINERHVEMDKTDGVYKGGKDYRKEIKALDAIKQHTTEKVEF